MNNEVSENVDLSPGRLKSLDLAYKLHFSEPAFDVLECRTALLKALYEKLPPSFSFDTDDVRFSHGDTLSEFRISINFRQGKANIDITPEIFGMSFSELPKRESMHLSRKVVSSMLEAVTNVLPGVEISMTQIDATFQLDIDGSNSARDHLNRRFKSLMFNFSNIEKASQYHEINFDMMGENDSWIISCHARGQIELNSRLALSFFAMYGEDDTIDGLKNKINHLDCVITELLPQIGVDLQ